MMRAINDVCNNYINLQHSFQMSTCTKAAYIIINFINNYQCCSLCDIMTNLSFSSGTQLMSSPLSVLSMWPALPEYCALPAWGCGHPSLARVLESKLDRCSVTM